MKRWVWRRRDYLDQHNIYAFYYRKQTATTVVGGQRRERGDGDDDDNEHENEERTEQIRVRMEVRVMHILYGQIHSFIDLLEGDNNLLLLLLCPWMGDGTVGISISTLSEYHCENRGTFFLDFRGLLLCGEVSSCLWYRNTVAVVVLLFRFVFCLDFTIFPIFFYALSFRSLAC